MIETLIYPGVASYFWRMKNTSTSFEEKSTRIPIVSEKYYSETACRARKGSARGVTTTNGTGSGNGSIRSGRPVVNLEKAARRGAARHETRPDCMATTCELRTGAGVATPT